jgi:hypothetical protein
MALRYLGKWSGSPDGDSPTLWVDDETGYYFMQGYKVDDQAVVNELLKASGRDDIPERETLITFPPDMVDLFPEVSSGEDPDTR